MTSVLFPAIFGKNKKLENIISSQDGDGRRAKKPTLNELYADQCVNMTTWLVHHRNNLWVGYSLTNVVERKEMVFWRNVVYANCTRGSNIRDVGLKVLTCFAFTNSPFLDGITQNKLLPSMKRRLGFAKSGTLGKSHLGAPEIQVLSVYLQLNQYLYRLYTPARILLIDEIFIENTPE